MTTRLRPAAAGADEPTPGRSRPRPRALVAAALVVAALAAACGGGGPATPAGSTGATPAGSTTVGTVAPTGPPYAVEHLERTIVDPDRPTAIPGGPELAPDRTLRTAIHLPVTDHPVPLVVFAHGLDGHPRKFTELFDAWARAGFAVAAPAFPVTNDDVEGGGARWADIAQQPADLSLVLDEVLAGAAGADPALDGRIDPDRIGAAGLSLGGGTAYAVTFNTCCADGRITAALVLSGSLFAIGGDYELDGRVPLLIVHGTADASLPYAGAEAAFAQAAAPVWFVTLVGGLHATPFENPPSEHDELGETITTRWWEAWLGGDEGALDDLTAAVETSPLATIAAKP